MNKIINNCSLTDEQIQTVNDIYFKGIYPKEIRSELPAKIAATKYLYELFRGKDKPLLTLHQAYDLFKKIVNY